jgi:hypothetical protein
MPSRDVRLELDPKVSLTPDQYTATGNGTGIDLQGAEAALIVIPTGPFGGTGPTASYKVQESDDNSTFTDVADTDLIGVTGNTSGVALAASAVQKVSYIGNKRYVRVALSAVAGTSPVIRVGGDVVRAHLRHAGGVPV